MEAVSSSDGSEGNEISTLGILGYEDYDEEQPVLVNNGVNHKYSHHHEAASSQNGNAAHEIQQTDEKRNQDIAYTHDEYLRKSQLTQKNNTSTSFPCNIDSSFVVGTRSSFGSSTRSNSSSLGTNGTNNSLSSRGSATDTQNMPAPFPPRSSPNTSSLGDTFARNMDPDAGVTAERGIKHAKGNSAHGQHGNEYFVLNSWNAEKSSRDVSGQTGSLSSFSSSNGSGRSRPFSNKSNLSSERK